MKVLSISARAMHGKDFTAAIAQELAAEVGMKFARFSFAWPLKARVFAEGAPTGLSWHDIATKPPAVRKLLQEVGTERGRNVFGEDFWMLQAEAFLRLMEEADKSLDGVIIADCRFPNEVEFARLGGFAPSLVRQTISKVMDQDLEGQDPVFRIGAYLMGVKAKLFKHQLEKGSGLALYIQSDRPTLTGEAALHPSETALDSLDKSTAFDGVIVNNLTTTAEDIRQQLMPHILRLKGM
jgi:hypothetical protein